MNLLAKKTFVCKRCGMEYEAVIDLRGNKCKECEKIYMKEKAEIRGYIDYNKKTKFIDKINEENYIKIIEHRDTILSKYYKDNMITLDELREVGKTYKCLSNDQFRDVLEKIHNANTTVMVGAAYNNDIFVVSGVEKVIVDIEDIFAVGFLKSNNSNFKVNGHEVLWCVVFTNDPYIPVFSMLFVMKKGFLDITKSKKGREAIINFFESNCTHLTYPVGELNDIKKIIKSEKNVRGLVDMKYILKQIDNAYNGKGIYDINGIKEKTKLDNFTVKMLQEYGYIIDEDIARALNFKNGFVTRYWLKKIKEIDYEDKFFIN